MSYRLKKLIIICLVISLTITIFPLKRVEAFSLFYPQEGMTVIAPVLTVIGSVEQAGKIIVGIGKKGDWVKKIIEKEINLENEQDFNFSFFPEEIKASSGEIIQLWVMVEHLPKREEIIPPLPIFVNFTWEITLQHNPLPSLNIYPFRLAFDEILEKSRSSLNLTLINSGGGLLEGVVSTDKPWISVTPLNFRGNKINLKVTVDSLNLSLGYHQGEISITSTGGNRKVLVSMTVAPPLILTIDQPQQEFLTRHQEVEIKGRVNKKCILEINGAIENLKEDLSFEKKLALREGLNLILIEAFSFSGEKIEVTLRVTKDTIPPFLRVDLVDKTKVSTSEIVVKGETEPNATLTINNVLVTLDSAGRFNYLQKLSLGENLIVVTAKDKALNESVASFLIYYEPPPPPPPPPTPTITASVSPTSIVRGASAILRWSTTEANIVTISPGIGTVATSGSITVSPATTTTYTLTATGPGGTATSTITLVVTEPQPTVIKILLKINDTKAYVDGKLTILDAPPFIEKGRTMVPLRFIAEAFGAKVSWNSKEQKVTIELKGKIIELWIGKSTARVDGKNITLDVPPMLMPPGRTFVPIRFVAETLGSYVEWRAATREVYIEYRP